MEILVPGWSRAGFLKYLWDFIADFFILAFFDMCTVSKIIAYEMITMTKLAMSLTSSIPQKLVPGLNSSMGSYILVTLPDISNMLGRQIYGPLRRPFKLYMV